MLADVDVILRIVVAAAVQFTVLLIMMSSPLTFLIALSGKVPYYERQRLLLRGRVIFTLPAAFSIAVIAAYVTVGGGPWWLLAVFVAILGLIVLAYLYTPQSVRNLLGRYVVLREDSDRDSGR